MRRFGLIGKSLKHSFSKKYFTEKFISENISDCQYELFELREISELTQLLQRHKGELNGLNVTIPYKQEVINFLDQLNPTAEAIGAVNTIKIEPNGQLTGYNTDYLGFKKSLTKNWNLKNKKALVLGSGGAAKAIQQVLKDLNLPYQTVSRTASDQILKYDQLFTEDKWLLDYQLLINTTPLGTYPEIDQKPSIPYGALTADHLLFDLVYNPKVTAFLQEGLNAGAQVKNGYEMLVGQAEAAWEIWNQK